MKMLFLTLALAPLLVCDLLAQSVPQATPEKVSAAGEIWARPPLSMAEAVAIAERELATRGGIESTAFTVVSFIRRGPRGEPNYWIRCDAVAPAVAAAPKGPVRMADITIDMKGGAAFREFQADVNSSGGRLKPAPALPLAQAVNRAERALAAQGLAADHIIRTVNLTYTARPEDSHYLVEFVRAEPAAGAAGEVAPTSDEAASVKVLSRQFTIDMKGNVFIREVTMNADGKRAAHKTLLPLEDKP